MSKLNNIVKIHYKDALGSAFVLPTMNKECMFLITAHHVLKKDNNVEFDKLKIYDFDDNEVEFIFYEDGYYFDLENDFCVLKINTKSEFLLPTVAVAYKKESFELIGFPKRLYGSSLKQHSLSCEFNEINNNTIFATILSPIENYTTEEHELIEGFSGGAFIHEKEDVLYFFGIENQTVTQDTAYNLIRGISGEYILKTIYERYFEESEAPFETIFNFQPSDIHEIYASDESDINDFKNLVNKSKVRISDIDDVIGDKYEIDRSEILDKIKITDSKFISIIGDAGSGKTALAKKYIIDEEFVLYARAEQFAQEDNITNIWKCDIEKISHILKSKKITVFIDALEFIADQIGRFDSLNQMYEIANRNINIKIIATCRTSDISAFLAIESKYNVSSFEIEPLSRKEIDDIMKNFSILIDLNNEKYFQLLESPFYINLIVRNHFDISNINDESSFRELIFNEVICFKSECSRHNVSFDDVVSTIKMIVFSRAKDFSLGVHKDDIQNNILLALESKNIIIEKDCCIRLKYDIFEDIVFEREFDKEFVTCRGNYNHFYESIINYGKCIYRRYQIWIANKLHIDDARKKFIYELIFNNCIESEWKKQTIIGIVKSKHCIEFFDEYEEELFENNILKDFIDIINLYSFSMRINDNSNLVLYPTGIARGKVIDIIKKTGVYKKDDLIENSTIKLCDDYTLSCDTNVEFSESACFIIENIIDEHINNAGERWYYSSKENVCPLLVILYRLANSCTDWIDKYFEKLILYFKSGDSYEKRFASDIAEFTMLNATRMLAKHNMEKLSELATQFWTYNDMSANLFSDYNKDYKYGLNKHAEEYHNVFRSPFDNLFYLSILYADFSFALNWTICFINKAVDKLLQDCTKEEYTVQIYFADDKTIHNYYATKNFWLMGIQEHNGPKLLSDMIYLLKNFFIKQLETLKEDVFIGLAYFIKESIYAKSNNIALLTIIEAIGLHFMNELPGYALDLASCMELIYLDIERFQFYIKSPTKELIEKQIYACFGIPAQLITERYKLDEKCRRSLQEYVFANYICCEKQREKCNAICDYLYEKFPDNIDNSEENLQIQKMDGRKAVVEDLGDGRFAIGPQIEGNAESIVKETKRSTADNNYVNQMLGKCGLKEGEIINLDCVNQTIDYIIQHSFERNVFKVEFEQPLISLICIVINDESTSSERKNELCTIWLDKLFDIFDNHYPVINENLILILFRQLKKDISANVKNRIKKFILACLTNKTDNGIIKKYTQVVMVLLNDDEELAELYFITILKLSEKVKSESDDEIIIKYLINEQKSEPFSLDCSAYDFDKLSYVTQCGLNIDNVDYLNVIIILLKLLKNSFKAAIGNRYNDVDLSTIYRIESFLQKEIKQNSTYKKTIDIIFDYICTSTISNQEKEFYYEVFSLTLPSYFDGSNDKSIRKNIRDVFEYLEQKIFSIQDEQTRIQLYKPLILCSGKYGGGDWSKFKASYTKSDKQFLNDQIKKYGKYYPSDVLYNIYHLQITELLPEILTSINYSLININDEKELDAVLKDKNNKYIIEEMIFKAFSLFSDEIKCTQSISDAFESILCILIEHNYEKAAVILDEYRIH